jgi:hypothetical protein
MPRRVRRDREVAAADLGADQHVEFQSRVGAGQEGLGSGGDPARLEEGEIAGLAIGARSADQFDESGVGEVDRYLVVLAEAKQGGGDRKGFEEGLAAGADDMLGDGEVGGGGLAPLLLLRSRARDCRLHSGGLAEQG